MARNVTLGLLVAAGALASAAASAQSTSSTIESQPVEARRYTAEIKPLTTFLSAVPGVGAIGLGAEAKLAPTTAVFADLHFVDSNLPEKLDRSGRDKAQDDIYPEDVTGRTGNFGARFYGQPSGHTFYTGVKVGFVSMDARYTYKDETVQQTTRSLTPGLEAGYRWAWNNGVILRTGASVAANIIQRHDVDSDRQNADVEKATDKIDERSSTPILAGLDVGLGYQF